jgi:hypothetical protein
MVSIPLRKFDCWSAPWEGLGVLGREGTGVIEREVTPFSPFSFNSKGINHEVTQVNHPMNYTLLDVPSFQADIVVSSGRDDWMTGRVEGRPATWLL